MTVTTVDIIGPLLITVLIIVLAVAFAFVLRRIGAPYARRRLHKTLAPEEDVLFQARCHRTKERLPILHLSRGTAYVTDRRLLWRTDIGLWPTKFEEIPIGDVTSVSVTKVFGVNQVRIVTPGKVLLFVPFQDGFWGWPSFNNTGANALADYIENHPLRRSHPAS